MGITTITAEDCMQKGAEWGYLVNRLVKRARERFPWSLQTRAPEETVIKHRMGLKDKPLLNKVLDLVFWPASNGTHDISGKTVNGEPYANENSARARVIEALIRRNLEMSPRALQTEEIVTELLVAKEDVARLIHGIKRSLNEDARERVVPYANEGYRIGDRAQIGLVE
jgi:hypothetical protein